MQSRSKVDPVLEKYNDTADKYRNECHLTEEFFCKYDPEKDYVMEFQPYTTAKNTSVVRPCCVSLREREQISSQYIEQQKKFLQRLQRVAFRLANFTKKFSDMDKLLHEMTLEPSENETLKIWLQAMTKRGIEIDKWLQICLRTNVFSQDSTVLTKLERYACAPLDTIVDNIETAFFPMLLRIEEIVAKGLSTKAEARFKKSAGGWLSWTWQKFTTVLWKVTKAFKYVASTAWVYGPSGLARFAQFAGEGIFALSVKMCKLQTDEEFLTFYQSLRTTISKFSTPLFEALSAFFFSIKESLYKFLVIFVKNRLEIITAAQERKIADIKNPATDEGVTQMKIVLKTIDEDIKAVESAIPVVSRVTRSQTKAMRTEAITPVIEEEQKLKTRSTQNATKKIEPTEKKSEDETIQRIAKEEIQKQTRYKEERNKPHPNAEVYNLTESAGNGIITMAIMFTTDFLSKTVAITNDWVCKGIEKVDKKLKASAIKKKADEVKSKTDPDQKKLKAEAERRKAQSAKIKADIKAKREKEAADKEENKSSGQANVDLDVDDDDWWGNDIDSDEESFEDDGAVLLLTSDDEESAEKPEVKLSPEEEQKKKFKNMSAQQRAASDKIAMENDAPNVESVFNHTQKATENDKENGIIINTVLRLLWYLSNNGFIPSEDVDADLEHFKKMEPSELPKHFPVVWDGARFAYCKAQKTNTDHTCVAMLKNDESPPVSMRSDTPELYANYVSQARIAIEQKREEERVKQELNTMRLLKELPTSAEVNLLTQRALDRTHIALPTIGSFASGEQKTTANSTFAQSASKLPQGVSPSAFFAGYPSSGSKLSTQQPSQSLYPNLAQPMTTTFPSGNTSQLTKPAVTLSASNILRNTTATTTATTTTSGGITSLRLSEAPRRNISKLNSNMTIEERLAYASSPLSSSSSSSSSSLSSSSSSLSSSSSSLSSSSTTQPSKLLYSNLGQPIMTNKFAARIVPENTPPPTKPTITVSNIHQNSRTTTTTMRSGVSSFSEAPRRNIPKLNSNMTFDELLALV